MLSYELAKELRDNGFSQEEGDGYFEYGEEKQLKISEKQWNDLKNNTLHMLQITDVESYYVPTLSELIEALPKVIDGAYFNIYWFDDVWRSAYTITECEDTFADGKTLEEAVANLWLELNKK